MGKQNRRLTQIRCTADDFAGKIKNLEDVVGEPERLYDSIKTYDDVENLKGKKIESLFIDFKEVVEGGVRNSSNADNYAKALSGFANSSGGVLLWGVSDKDKDNKNTGIVQDLKPFEGITKFAAELNDLAGQWVFPSIDGLKIEAIPKEEGSDEGFVKVLIPESEKMPHFNQREHRYYNRSGSNFIRMEHYQIDDMFGRRPKPVLEIYPKAERLKPTGSEYGYYEISIICKNVGRGSARYPVCKLEVNCGNCKFGCNSDYKATTHSIVRIDDIPEIIHPEMELEIMEFRFENQNSDIIRFDFTVYCENCKPFEITHYGVFSKIPRADYVDPEKIPKFFNSEDKNQITDIEFNDIDKPEVIPNR